ncbi:MAG: hypothetical protein DHS20C18_20610 [Saprospiraceae bacterium]|nr:MAG: hypothetical protein DHS20C18_20610 [Saprospiraceae bacterium]
MRTQLQKFTAFTNTLLPHETEYLLSIQQFNDEERLGILRLVNHNCHQIDQFTPYDTAIDKRKYNHLQNWIATRLSKIDVDEHFQWMINMEQKIMTDSIQISEEKELLKAIRKYQHPGFFFTKFYELVEQYRHFLLIRIRYADHEKASVFLDTFREDYLFSKSVHERLHTATLDIIGQYSGKNTESIQWEEWLTDVFYNEKLDGLNRYLALVRLTFISFNYRKFELLRDKFDYLDAQFSTGRYYSKRLLLNYYSNRLMLHSSFQEYDKAAYYGYLSVRHKNHDYIHYVNNLCAVLLRMQRHHKAYQLMKNALPEMKVTKNQHSKVGFVAFYIETLNKNQLYKNAESYGDIFLRAYSKEILEYRWHLFFTVYFEALLRQNHTDKLLKIARKYKLQELDLHYQSKATYLPSIPIYIQVAQYKESLINRKTIHSQLAAYLEQYAGDKDKSISFNKQLSGLKDLIPEIVNHLQGLKWQV